MITLKRTDSDDPEFRQLVIQLDRDLAIRNGENNAFFVQYNQIEQIRHVVLAYFHDAAVGCGAMKIFEHSTMEIKRMYVPHEMRRKGIAGAVLNELETWAAALGYKKCCLETGVQMPEAISLYKRCGYQFIPNYGPYVNVETSVCFEKVLTQIL